MQVQLIAIPNKPKTESNQEITKFQYIKINFNVKS